MRRFVSFGPAVVVLAALVAMAVLAPAAVQTLAGASQTARVTLARDAIAADDILLRIDAAVTAVADAVRPTVVHIEAGRRRGFSSGTGWVYDTGGHIVTNAHVVRGSDSVSVEFADGRLEQARVLDMDFPTDIAVLRVPGRVPVIPSERASGERPRQGQRVFAFGSPFGFKFSMSQGIVSGLGRDPGRISNFGGFTNFIQTDAAVNPGNSGGPLIDAAGRVIGMNVAIATARDAGNDLAEAEGDSAGISFAIPLPVIETVVDQIIAGESVSRGFLGVVLGPSLTFETPGGEIVRGVSVRVNEDSPAARAGMETGDVVARVAGQAVADQDLFTSVVGVLSAGRPVPVLVYRDGEPVELEVTLGELPIDVLASRTARAMQFQLGVLISPLERARISDPVVRRVFEESAAWSAGLREGHRIVSVEGRPVQTAFDVFLAFTEAELLKARPVQIEVIDTEDPEDGARTLTLRLGS